MDLKGFSRAWGRVNSLLLAGKIPTLCEVLTSQNTVLWVGLCGVWGYGLDFLQVSFHLTLGLGPTLHTHVLVLRVY